MEKIFITDNELKELPIIGSGKEGTVYQYDESIAIKIFNKEVKLDSKMQKISLLHDSPIKAFTTIPKKLVYTPTSSGYSMEYKKEYLTLCDLEFLNYTDKVLLLRKIKVLIELLHTEHKIIIGDIRRQNILIKNNDITFCDVDNFKINDINPELLNIYSKLYVRNYDRYDEGLDIFSFNVMSLYFLLNSTEENVIDYIINTDKIENACIRNTFMHVLNEEIYTNEYIIDDLPLDKTKRKQF